MSATEFKKLIFNIIAKNNIDHNTRLITATKHYYGISFSFFEFSSVAFPGDIIFYHDEPHTITKWSNSRMLIALLHHTQMFKGSFHHILHLPNERLHSPSEYREVDGKSTEPCPT